MEERNMEIGVNMSILSQSMDVAALAQKAESLGFESIWLPEHPVMPVNPASRYHGSPDGKIPEYMSEMADPYIGLARASAVTSKLKLGTGISLIPERNPLVLAKEIASLDYFSGGRFILGIGTGWLREETEIMGGDFDHRWTQAREAVLAMKELWTKDEAEFHGKYFNFPPVKCFPKPAQKPHPPVFLGGSARNVFKRVVAWGDGWMPTGVSPEQVKRGRAALDELAEAAGRNPRSIQISVFGQPADSEVIKGFEDAGADRVMVRLPNTRDQRALDELEQMAERVLR
jgi:probable F420-dependent oxidoreductase